MALNNYTNLKAAVENWSHREDIVDHLDDFIKIAETQFYKTLRLKDMITTETSSTGTGDRVQALPTRFLETIRYDMTVSGERYLVDFRTNEQMVIRSGTGTPAYYTITSQVEYDIEPDLDYTTNHIHYAKLAALDSTNSTNAILTNYPDVYLYGCLWALFQWARNTEQESLYLAKLTGAISDANEVDIKGRYGVSMQKVRRGRNP